MRVNETCEKTLLEKIQDLEEQIQHAGAREKEIVTQRDAKVKQDVETTIWKVLTLE
jgi:hypothetical protein